MPTAADSDWEQVFGFAAQAKRVEGSTCHPGPFTVADVAQVIDWSDGENDGRDWMVVGLLNDTRYFFIVAGCDYTGWDCQCWGTAWVAGDLAELARFGLTDEARERLPGVHAALSATT